MVVHVSNASYLCEAACCYLLSFLPSLAESALICLTNVYILAVKPAGDLSYLRDVLLSVKAGEASSGEGLINSMFWSFKTFFFLGKGYITEELLS